MMKIHTDKILKADKRSKLEKLNKKSFFEILINKYSVKIKLRTTAHNKNGEICA